MKAFITGFFKWLAIFFATLALVVATLSLWPLASPLQQKDNSGATVLTPVNIVDVLNDRVLMNQSILIEQGRIIQISDPSTLTAPTGANIVDGHNSYVIPGLWDMHNHFSFPTAPQMSMPLYIAAGVMNVRDMQAIVNLNDERQQWRSLIQAGSLLGPRIVAFADEIVGEAGDDQDVNEVVRRSAQDSGTFIKVYSEITPDRYFQLASAAAEQGVAFAGHYPLAIDAAVAARAGQRSFEHAHLFITQSFSGSEILREKFLRYFTENRDFSRTMTERHEMLHGFDVEQFDALVATMKQNGTYFCPTHITRKFEAFAYDSSYRNDPRRKFLPPLIDWVWQSDADSEAQWQGEAGRQYLLALYQRGLTLTGMANAAGVKILAGGDTLDSYSFPGFSIHDELEQLVLAGLTPAQALTAATWQPAAYFSKTDEYGSVAEGKVADLVLLKGNPLHDIQEVRHIDAVMFDGGYYGNQDLKMFQDYVEANNSGIKGVILSLKMFWHLVLDKRR